MRALPVARPLRSLTGPDVRQQVILRSHPGEDFPECDAMWTQPQVVKSVRRRPAETDEDRRSHLADRSGQIGLAAERRLSLPSEQPECCSLAGHSPVWTRQNRSVL